MKVVFLDRDGVINKYPGHGEYVTNHRQFDFIPGSIEGVRKLKEKGFKVFVVSNQGGVSKGLYSQRDLDFITKKMLNGLKKKGVEVDGVHYCIHTSKDNCNCRKPKTGLLEEAIKDFTHKTNHTFFIGDSFQDMNAARAFKAKTILVLSGKEKISNRDNWEFEPDYVFDNLLLAAHYLCAHYG